jgi:hypothetical protein
MTSLRSLVTIGIDCLVLNIVFEKPESDCHC